MGRRRARRGYEEAACRWRAPALALAGAELAYPRQGFVPPSDIWRPGHLARWPCGGIGLDALLSFYANGIGTGTSLQFMLLWDGNGNADGTERFIVAPYAMTFRRLAVSALTAGTGSGSTTYTLRVNGANTALALVVDNDTAPYGGTATGEITVAAGDRVSLGKQSTGTISGSPVGVVVNVSSV